MARKFVAGSSDAAFHDAFPLAGIGGVVISLWLNRTDNTQTTSLLYEYDQSNGLDYIPNQSVNGDLIRAYSSPGGTYGDSWTPTGTGAWHHYFFVVPGTGEGVPPPVPQQIWLDGVNQTLNSPSHGPISGTWAASSPWTTMCRRISGVNSNFYSGQIAEMAMWSSHTMIVGAAPFVKQLAAGVNPLKINTVEMIMYVPYLGADSPEPDYHGKQRNFSLGGSPSKVRHPPTVRGMVNFQD